MVKFLTRAARHGFGVGPSGAKFKFAQQYLKTLELHAPAWHVPTFAQTLLSRSILQVEQYMIKVITSALCSRRIFRYIEPHFGIETMSNDASARLLLNPG